MKSIILKTVFYLHCRNLKIKLNIRVLLNESYEKDNIIKSRITICKTVIKILKLS
jgi:hypothetical protein